MARAHSPSKLNIACDVLLAWRAIANGVTASTAKTRHKYWQAWCKYCAQFQDIDPYLTNISKPEKAILITGFASRARTGAFGLGNQVKVSSVKDALAAISKTFQLVGQQSPIYETEGEYILPVKRCLEGFRREDPPTIPQLAVPVAVPEELAKLSYCSTCPFQQAIGDLGLIGFYYLLRSGEYTKPRMVKQNGKMVPATRTRQFRVGDIGFFKNNKVLPRRSPLKQLLSADSATMKISNQKNGRMGQTLHQQSTGTLGAVAGLARRVHHILSNGGDESNVICDVYLNKKWTSVTGSNMVHAIRESVKALNLQENGYDPDMVGAHSLRAGGAMALKLMGYNDSDIQKFGRWTSNTWQMYIHSQIGKLSDGVAAKMSTHMPFVNIAFIEASSSSQSSSTA